MTGLIVLILGTVAAGLWACAKLDDLFDFSEPLKRKKRWIWKNK